MVRLDMKALLWNGILTTYVWFAMEGLYTVSEYCVSKKRYRTSEFMSSLVMTNICNRNNNILFDRIKARSYLYNVCIMSVKIGLAERITLTIHVTMKTF